MPLPFLSLCFPSNKKYYSAKKNVCVSVRERATIWLHGQGCVVSVSSLACVCVPSAVLPCLPVGCDVFLSQCHERAGGRAERLVRYEQVWLRKKLQSASNRNLFTSKVFSQLSPHRSGAGKQTRVGQERYARHEAIGFPKRQKKKEKEIPQTGPKSLLNTE